MSAGRLPFLQAAWVIARRDFVAVLYSRAFLFFLLGPLFVFAIGGMAGGVTRQVNASAQAGYIGVAMDASDNLSVMAARNALAKQIGLTGPDMQVLRDVPPGEAFDPAAALSNGPGGLDAVLTGTPEAPVLTGPAARIRMWQGPVSLVAHQAREGGAVTYPPVRLSSVAATASPRGGDRLLTAQSGQALLFLLIMLLAGMVLSNLVEEKTNKIIEVLASAVPMDAVFMGKLFAMLGVSMVGILVWGAAGSTILLLTGGTMHAFPAPAVGWPLFALLGTVYFMMGYLLLGSLFLTIGSMASTVREVQTLSMPVTMMQLLVFFFATYAMTRPGSWLEQAAIIFPPSSPFAMLARAAQYDALWPHVLAIGWQVLAVGISVKAGAALFRRKVMKSGPAPSRKRRKGALAAA